MAMIVDYEIIVNPMDPADWISCVDQSYASNNWRLSYNDYQEWLKAFGKENFQLLVAKEKHGGTVIGFVLFAIHESIEGSPRIAQLGCYWVKPEMRGHGIGDKLFNMAIKKENEAGTNLTLLAASHMSPKYANRHGFSQLTDWQLIVFQVNISDINTEMIISTSRTSSIEIINWKEIDMEKLLEYDREIFGGVDRRKILPHYFNRSDLWTKIAVDQQTGQVLGICSIKAVSYKRLLVVPLYANTKAVAEHLLYSTINTIPDLKQFNHIDFYVPDCNQSAIDIVHRLGEGKVKILLKVQSQFTKAVIAVPIDRVYAITAYALTFV